MKYVFQLLQFFLIYITISSYAAADFVENPDFELPPANATANATTWLLTGANSLPGWSLNGTVWYVSSSSGHAVQLGPNGRISQTIKTTGSNSALDYILGFTVAAQSQECASNLTALNVTVTLVDGMNDRVSRPVYLQQNSSRNLRERHAFFLGRMAGGEHVHLQIESVTTSKSRDHNFTCWPLVDTFTVNRNQMPSWYNGNLLSNEGFEVGPAFLKNSADGIILNNEQEESNSPLQDWSIIGTIRYIDSRHYRVPRGGAAVELLSGGVRKDLIHLSTKHAYTLNFTLGDANNSCVGDFTVYVQVGYSTRYNFTMQSDGRGSAFKQTLKFEIEDDEQSSETLTTTSIMFYSDDEMRTRDGLMCGPVLDYIFLADNSHGERKQVRKGVLLFTLFIASLMIMIK